MWLVILSAGAGVTGPSTLPDGRVVSRGHDHATHLMRRFVATGASGGAHSHSSGSSRHQNQLASPMARLAP
jgi:hypothetical protein